MPYKNRKEQLKAQKEHYKKNKSKYTAQQRERRRKKREWLVEYKSTLSCECGENHPAVLDFHHDDDNKEIGVADAIHYCSIERVMKEIEKCIVVCSNCHRKLHWKDKQP